MSIKQSYVCTYVVHDDVTHRWGAQCIIVINTKHPERIRDIVQGYVARACARLHTTTMPAVVIDIREKRGGVQ